MKVLRLRGRSLKMRLQWGGDSVKKPSAAKAAVLSRMVAAAEAVPLTRRTRFCAIAHLRRSTPKMGHPVLWRRRSGGLSFLLPTLRCAKDGAPARLWLWMRNAGVLRCAQNDTSCLRRGLRVRFLLRIASRLPTSGGARYGAPGSVAKMGFRRVLLLTLRYAKDGTPRAIVSVEEKCGGSSLCSE
jgi:hypothetical protein